MSPDADLDAPPIFTRSVKPAERRVTLFSPDESEIWTVDGANQFVAYNIASNQVVANHPLANTKVSIIEVSPQRDYVLVTQPDGLVNIHDATDWSLLRTWRSDIKNDATCVKWSPDQALVAIGRWAGRWANAEVWEVATERRIASSDRAGNAFVWQEDRLLCFGPFDSCTEIRMPNGLEIPFSISKHPKTMSPIYDDPSGPTSFVTSGNGEYRLFDNEKGTPQLPNSDHKIGVHCAIAPVGNRLAVRNESQTLIVDSMTNKELVSLPASLHFSWSPTADRIALITRLSPNAPQGTPASHVVCQIHNAKTGKELQSFHFEGQERATLAWSPDGRYLAIRVTPKSTLHVFDTSLADLKSIETFPENLSEKDLSIGLPVWRSNTAALTVFGGQVFQVDIADRLVASTPDEFKNVRLQGGSIDYSRDSFRMVTCDSQGVTAFDPAHAAPWMLPGYPACGLPRILPDGRRGMIPAMSFYDYPARALDLADRQHLGCCFPFVGLDGWLTIGPTGHYQGSEGIESEILYVAEHLDGHQQTYTPAEFAKTFNWKNDPKQATFLKLVETIEVRGTADAVPDTRNLVERFGHALSFSNPDDIVDVPLTGFDLSQPWTIESWCQLDHNHQPLARVVLKLGPVYLQCYKNTWRFVAAHVDANGHGEWGVEIPEGSADHMPIHLVAQWTGKEMQFFVDGRAVSNPPGTWGTNDSVEEIIRILYTPVASTRLTIGNIELPKRIEVLGGTIAAVRVSKGVQYTAPFTPGPLTKNADTITLYDFSQGSGDVLKDISGHGHDGKIIGAKWVTGDELPVPVIQTQSGGLRFDGVDDYVEVPTLSYYQPKLTVEVEFTPDMADPPKKNYCALASWPNRLALRYWNGGNRTDAAAATAWMKGDPSTVSALIPRFETGVRQRLAFVLDGQSLLGFLNGRPQQTKQLPHPIHDGQGRQSSRLFVGCELDGRPDLLKTQSHFLGTIHRLRISKTARTDLSHPLIADENTIALYDFSQGSGDVLKDISGNGHDGKIIGAMWVGAGEHPAEAPAGKKGVGLLFDQPMDHVAVPKVDIDLNQPWTIEAWCGMPVPISGVGRTPVLQLGPVYLTMKDFRDWNAITAYANSDRTVVHGVAIAARAENKPRTHLALEWDGDQLQFFVDGISTKTPPFTWGETDPPSVVIKRFLSSEADTPLNIGMELSSDGKSCFGGTIDTIRISRGLQYKKEFVPGEITTNADTIALYDFSQGSGDVLKDISGHGHDGKIIGAKWVHAAKAVPPVPITGVPRGGLSFNGVDAYVSIPRLPLDAGPMTIDTILDSRHLSKAGISRMFALDQGDGEKRIKRHILYQPYPDGTATFHLNAVNGMTTTVMQLAKIPTGRMRLTTLWDGSTLECYINGVRQNLYPYRFDTPQRTSEEYVCLGAGRVEEREGLGYFWPGTIDEFKVSVGLHPPEQTGIPTSLKNDANTIALYDFSQGSGDVLKDVSGHGHDGKIIGATWVGAGEHPAE